MTGRGSQELAEDKLAAIRDRYRDVLEHLNDRYDAYERSTELIKKSRELIKSSNNIIGRHGLSDLYRCNPRGRSRLSRRSVCTSRRLHVHRARLILPR